MWFLLVILLLVFYLFLGTACCRWVLYQETLPDGVRQKAYYLGYVPMLISSDEEESIVTPYGFSIYGSQYRSSLIKCYHLAGDYEPSLTLFLGRYLHKESIFLDVGANEGYFSLIAAIKGAQVYAVEPSRQNQDLLKRNVEGNSLSGRITLLPYAAGDANTQITFHESSLNGMWSSIGKGKTNFLSREVKVRMCRLEDVVPVRPDIVKIDVEGFEDKVLEGCSSWLRKRKTLWIIEMDDTLSSGQEIIRKLREAGYEKILTLVVDSACLPGKIYSPEEYHPGEFVGFKNFIFVPPCLSSSC
jgi:FkbM family methyltransferase